jgi:hypothetical protein
MKIFFTVQTPLNSINYTIQAVDLTFSSMIRNFTLVIHRMVLIVGEIADQQNRTASAQYRIKAPFSSNFLFINRIFSILSPLYRNHYFLSIHIPFFLLIFAKSDLHK